MSLLSSRRAMVLAAFALLLGFSLVAWLAAPAVSAAEIRVSNLVIRSTPQTLRRRWLPLGAP
jgi:hypothetical protein